MTRQEKINKFANRVLSWDRLDIRELTSRLYDLYFSITREWDASMDCWELTYERMEDYLDVKNLPTCPIPHDISTSERIWSMDKSRNCLISLDFESTNYGHHFKHMIRSLDQLNLNKARRSS